MSNGGVVRRPAVPAPVRIRRDVSKLQDADPILVFFRLAIREMKSKPLTDPLSWGYQAGIHDFDQTLPQGVDPKYWKQCEHGSWFFLSWHRMYLHFFEKIVASIVGKLPNGPRDWALPYWNYSASSFDGTGNPGAAALLPQPFRNPTLTQPLPVPLPNGQPDTHNYLWVAERTATANQGSAFLDNADTDLKCLKAKPFAGRGSDPQKIRSSFGGGRIKHHPPGGLPGALENIPHNAVHGAVGGATGFMGGFATAPLDPIFWLHHCNIDRLWEVWVQRQKVLGNLDRNPKETGRANAGGWLDEPWDFHDASGAVSITSKDVLNTRAAPLSYEYEDASDPFHGA